MASPSPDSSRNSNARPARPSGSFGTIGNDRPIEVVTERWYSTDLQIAVMTVHTDPMMGTVTTKLVNVTRGDPDASLFQVPSDYKVEVGKPNEPMYMPMKP